MEILPIAFGASQQYFVHTVLQGEPVSGVAPPLIS